MFCIFSRSSSNLFSVMRPWSPSLFNSSSSCFIPSGLFMLSSAFSNAALMTLPDACEFEAMSLKEFIVALSNLDTPVSISVRSRSSFFRDFSSSLVPSSAVLLDSPNSFSPLLTSFRTGVAPVFSRYLQDYFLVISCHFYSLSLIDLCFKFRSKKIH